MDLGFLNDLEVATPATPEKKTRTAAPINGDFRLRKAGKVEFSEEFKAKVGQSWIDLFFAHDWDQYPKDKPDVLFININAVDEEGKCNAPKADIKGDGTSVFVKTIFWDKLVKEFSLDEEVTYMDFKLEESSVDVPVALLPKVVARGIDKGKPDYSRRENITLIAVSPVLVVEEEAAIDEAEVQPVETTDRSNPFADED